MKSGFNFVKAISFSSIALASSFLFSCASNEVTTVDIFKDNSIDVPLNTTYKLETINDDLLGDLTFSSSDEEVAKVNETTGEISALKVGDTTITATDGTYTDTIKVNVYELSYELDAFEISISEDELLVGDQIAIDLTVSPESYAQFVTYEIQADTEVIKVENNTITALDSGRATILAKIGNLYSNALYVTVLDKNPYENIDEEEFYANYTRAVSYQDALYRSECYLMSGDISSQDQEPTVISNRPEENGKILRNSTEIYRNNGNEYVVCDYKGDEVSTVFKGGAYVTLEDVAAYVYAFGDIPANYTKSKSTSPSKNPWGEYLRLNFSYFSGDTSKYRYEPELPRISGCGGDLEYYEIDIGTTGTDCDPVYPAEIYNNGNRITRGAARIVFARYKNGKEINDINDKYVFYTYNHYNDFQEYLNYYNGWGDMFGNISGGGEISDYNPSFPPTSYIETIKKEF